MAPKSNPYINPTSEMQGQSPRIMVFSPWYYGHHPSYLRHLIRYWSQQQWLGELSIIVMPTFLKEHEDVVALTGAGGCSTVRFIPMTVEEQLRLESTRFNVAKAFVQYQLIRHYARILRATHVLLMHFDSCQIPLVLGLRLPCPFSAVYFRPALHCNHFSHYKATTKERRQQLREQIFLSRLFAHPQFKTLFCLDPRAVDFINQRFCGRGKAVHLPDPVEAIVPTSQDVEALRLKLGIEPGRQIFLAFGLLADGRKGTRQFLESLPLLKPELWQKICVLLVGEPFPAGQATVEEWLTPIRQLLPVQIVTQFGYVPEPDVPLYFQLANSVIAPYQQPAGTSGIVLLAAAAQKPILSSNYGLMGQLVKQYGLGLAVDTTIPGEIAKSLTRLLQEPSKQICSYEGMQSYAALNSPENFAGTVFQHTREE